MKLLNIFIILFVVSSLNAQERDATFMKIENLPILFSLIYVHSLLIFDGPGRSGKK